MSANQADSPFGNLSFLVWAIYFSLGICLAYSVVYLAFYAYGQSSGSAFTSSWDLAIWGIAIFLVTAWIAYNLELNMVKGYYRIYVSIGLLVAFCTMAVGVVSIILGLVDTIVMAVLSSLLLILCAVFAPDFFNTSRLRFSLPVLSSGLIIGSLLLLLLFA